ncbi:ferredoxin [Tropicimonas aquimaris]|uniref:Ferredoxin n=1 Tax=Tropicimonas aquimaris TaxID=914152 RepID=A0ABW3IQL7_9RHOB
MCTAPQSAGPDFESLEHEAGSLSLSILGGLHVAPSDKGIPEGVHTLLLLGPAEPGFWPSVTATPEFSDAAPDPLDRWSRRVIGDWAARIGAEALFPFGGPPFLPFLDWLTRTGRAWSSPVGLVVHAEAGLFLSVRGALALRQRIALPDPVPCPCDSCATRPCLSACPVSALGAGGYDTGRCHDHLDTGRSDCMELGCAVRRACPVSQNYPRLPAQSAFHMRAFHGTQ